MTAPKVCTTGMVLAWRGVGTGRYELGHILEYWKGQDDVVYIADCDRHGFQGPERLTQEEASQDLAAGHPAVEPKRSRWRITSSGVEKVEGGR